MNKIRGLVVAVLLGVWAFPAVSSAKTAPEPAPSSAPASPSSAPVATAPVESARTTSLAAREQQAKDLQDYKGGSGVAIYASSGAILVAVIVLIVLLA